MADTTTLKLKQAAAVAAVAVLVVLLETFGQAIPEWIRAAIYSTASGAVGKAFGQPVKEVLIAALQSLAKRRPDEAVSVAVSALKSLPPATAEAATARMFASLPPSARERASIAPGYGGAGINAPMIRFVHDDAVTPGDLATAPDGAPLVVRTTPPANDAAEPNTPAASPSGPVGVSGVPDDDAATIPNRPTRVRR
jgi:hypothetical protein